MSNVVSGALVIFLLIFVLFEGLNMSARSQQSFASSYLAQEQQANMSRQTAISLSNGAAATGTTVTADLSNTGVLPMEFSNKVDVIVDYTSTTGNHVVQRLTYTSGTPGANEWSVSAITPDVQDPGLLDANEVASLELQVSPAEKSGTTGVLRVSTPNGALAQTSFTW